MDVFTVLVLDDSNNTFMGLMATNLPFKKKIEISKKSEDTIEKVKKTLETGF